MKTCSWARGGGGAGVFSECMYLDINICSYRYHIIIREGGGKRLALFVQVSYIHNIGGILFSGRIGKDVCVCKGNDCEGVWNVNRYEL